MVLFIITMGIFTVSSGLMESVCVLFISVSPSGLIVSIKGMGIHALYRCVCVCVCVCVGVCVCVCVRS